MVEKNLTGLLVGVVLLLQPQNNFALTLEPQVLHVNNFTVQLQVPVGLRVEFLASMDGPRFLVFGPGGELLIGSNSSAVYRLNQPYRSPEVLVDIPGRNHSVAYRNESIYVAETAGLYEAPYAGPETTLQAEDFSLLAALPSATGGHWSRTVVVGPDQRLYIGIGISGNCSDEYLAASYPFEQRRGGVYVVDESSASPGLSPFSSGLRNPIGLAFHPPDGVLYATNAGPDNLGYDQPPEIFTALHLDSFHGMPWFQYYNGMFRSGECATSPAPRPAADATVPLATFAARSTPQGIAFVTNSPLGAEFAGNALVAIHGSWAVVPGGGVESRRPPKIAMVRFENNLPVGSEDVIIGFQRDDGSRFARPSGMAMGPDGNLYFTSDGGEVTGLFRLLPVESEGGGPVVSPPNFLLLRGNS